MCQYGRFSKIRSHIMNSGGGQVGSGGGLGAKGRFFHTFE